MEAQQRRLSLVTKTGAAVAKGLRSSRPSDSWRAELAAIVHASDDDRDLDRIHRELIDRASDLGSAASIAAYARTAKGRFESEPALAFLEGLLADTAAAPLPARPRLLADTLSVKEAAALLRVDERTIRNWNRKGILEGTQLGQRQLRIYRSSIPQFPPPVASTPSDAQGGVFDPDWAFFTRSPITRPDAHLK